MPSLEALYETSINNARAFVDSIHEIALTKTENVYLNTKYFKKRAVSNMDIEIHSCQIIIDNVYGLLMNYGDLMGMHFRWRPPQLKLIEALREVIIPVVYVYILGERKWAEWKNTIYMRNGVVRPKKDILLLGGRRSGKTEGAAAFTAAITWFMRGDGVSFFTTNATSVGLSGAKLVIERVRTILYKIQEYYSANTNMNAYYATPIERDSRYHYNKNEKITQKIIMDKIIDPTVIKITVKDKTEDIFKESVKTVEAHASGKVSHIFFWLAWYFFSLFFFCCW